MLTKWCVVLFTEKIVHIVMRYSENKRIKGGDRSIFAAGCEVKMAAMLYLGGRVSAIKEGRWTRRGMFPRPASFRRGEERLIVQRIEPTKRRNQVFNELR